MHQATLYLSSSRQQNENYIQELKTEHLLAEQNQSYYATVPNSITL